MVSTQTKSVIIEKPMMKPRLLISNVEIALSVWQPSQALLIGLVGLMDDF